MSSGRLLVVSADSVVQVSPVDQGLVQSARAILTSADPAAAFQAYLDEVDQVFEGVPPDQTRTRLNGVEFLAVDPVADSAALRAVDEALAHRVFRVDATEPPDSVAEATSILFVNGIQNSADEAANHMRVLRSFLRGQDSLFRSSGVQIGLFYNPTSRAEESETEAQRAARCAGMAVRRRQFLGYVSLYRLYSHCLHQREYNPVTDTDLFEAFVQWYNVEVDSRNIDTDARALADTMQDLRRAGRHVILVPHSQGNLMGRQAVGELRTAHQYSEQTDSVCVGVVTLSAPSDAAWQIPSNRQKHIVLLGDFVADIGGNSMPRSTNAITDAVQDTLAQLQARIDDLPEDPLGELNVTRFQMGLHFAARVYELGKYIHQAKNYLTVTPTRDSVYAFTKALYKDCAAATISLFFDGPPFMAEGTTMQVTAQVKNDSFEDLPNRKIGWSSSNPAVASIDSTGLIQAHTAGTTVITGRSGAVKAQRTMTVHEPSPYPPGVSVFGTWERLVPDGSGGNCLEKLVLDVGGKATNICDNGSNPTYHYSITANPPWIAGRMSRVPPTAHRWVVELTGDGNTLRRGFLTSPTDETPDWEPEYTRQ